MTILPSLGKKIALGGDYNPEQWREEIWREDVRLMKEAYINLVTVGVFSWSKFQPTERRYDFEWMDRLMDLLARNGIGVCMATGTASPPPWMTHRYPDVLPVTDEGVRLNVGSRQQFSPSSGVYRRFAEALVRKLARRYKGHPALKTWHVNNEYACHIRECHGDESTASFRRWLQSKYGSLERLNEAWGTDFWSQRYSRWDEILTPRRAPYHTNPSQCLDFKRFTSDEFLALLRMELKILRSEAPGIPITTNFMGFFKPLDYRSWATDLDYVSWDSYPDPQDETTARRTAAAEHDLMRSLKPDRPFLLMEQASSAVVFRPTNKPKRPGLQRLWSYQAIARGADGIMFFQWRASKVGAEKFHSAVIQHAPTDQSRIFREVKQLGKELAHLDPVVGSIQKNKVAFVFDWSNWWALELKSKPKEINYTEEVRHLHEYFYERNIGVDFVTPLADLRKYDLVVAPTLYLLSSAEAANIDRYVFGGGTLVGTYFTGIVDEYDHVITGGYPAFLRRVFGLWIEEWVPYNDGCFNAVRLTGSSKRFSCTHWCDLIHLEGAEALAVYSRDYFNGMPAVASHSHGKGTAFYLGTRLDVSGRDWLLEKAVRRSKLWLPPKVPSGIELTMRESSNARYLFLLNHGPRPVTVSLAGRQGRELITGKATSTRVRISPLDVRVLEFKL
jgi:beta-galactosidase